MEENEANSNRKVTFDLGKEEVGDVTANFDFKNSTII